MRQQPRRKPIQNKIVEVLARKLGSLIKNIIRRSLYPTSHTDQAFGSTIDGIGFLQRPWIRLNGERHPKAVFLLAKSNYIVFEKLGWKVRPPNLRGHP